MTAGGAPPRAHNTALSGNLPKPGFDITPRV